LEYIFAVLAIYLVRVRRNAVSSAFGLKAAITIAAQIERWFTIRFERLWDPIQWTTFWRFSYSL